MMEALSNCSTDPTSRQSTRLGHAVSPLDSSNSSSSYSSSSSSSSSSVPFVDMMAPKVVMANSNGAASSSSTSSVSSASTGSEGGSSPHHSVEAFKSTVMMVNGGDSSDSIARHQPSPCRSDTGSTDALVIDESPSTPTSAVMVNGSELVTLTTATSKQGKNCDISAVTSTPSEGLVVVLASSQSSSPSSKVLPTISTSALTCNGTTSPVFTTSTSSSNNSRATIPALSVVAALKPLNNHTTTIASLSTVSLVNGISSATGGGISLTTLNGAGDVATAAVTTQQAQKRPMNAFLIFCKRHRSVVRQKYPHLENRSITKILGEWWAALDAEEKHNYTDLARQYKEAFMKANPHFKWYKTTDLRPPPPPPSSPPSGSVTAAASTLTASSSSNSSVPTVGQTSNSSSTSAAVIINTGTSLSLAPTQATGGTSAVVTTATVFPASLSTSSVLPASTNGSIQQAAAGQQQTSSPPPSSSSSQSAAASPTGMHLTNGNSNGGGGGSGGGNGGTVGSNCNSNGNNPSSSTPKPPKKRYLESLESGDYTKNKSTASALNFAGNSYSAQSSPNNQSTTITPNSGPSAMSIPTSNSGGNQNTVVAPMRLHVGPLILDDVTAWRVIEEKLGGNAGSDSATSRSNSFSDVVLGNRGGLHFDNAMFEDHATSAGNRAGPSGRPQNGILDLVQSNPSEMKAVNLMMEFVGKVNATANHQPTNITNHHSPTRSIKSDGSDTDSDEEMKHLSQHQDLHNTSMAAQMILQPRTTTTIAPLQPVVEQQQEEDDEDKPLNLSSSANSVSSVPKSQTTEQVYEVKNQMIFDRYIDKFLSTGTVCNHNGYANPANASSRKPDSSLIMLKPQSAHVTTVVTPTGGILNLTTTTASATQPTNFLSSTVTTSTTPVVGTATTASVSSKLVLVPKDFSLQQRTASSISTSVSTATVANGTTIISTGNKRALQTETSGSPLKIGSGMGNSNVLVKTSTSAAVESNGTTPNKRNRTNGNVIGVSDMIMQQQQQQQQQQNQSKFVTGSFDLEEHIRALPQLADTHLVNALHLRNVESQNGKASGSVTTANLVVVSQPNVSSANLKSAAILAKAVQGTNVPTTTTVLLHHPQSPPPTVASLSNIPLHIQAAAENLSQQTNSKTTIETAALPLRLVTTGATGNNGAAASTTTRMQMSPSVLIKLAPGQTLPIAGTNVVMAAPMTISGGAATMSGVDGSILTPLIIRGPPTTTAGMANKPVDLSMAIQQSAQSADAAGGSVIGGLQQLGATIRTTTGLSSQAYLSSGTLAAIPAGATAGAQVIVTSSAPSSLNALNSMINSSSALAASAPPSSNSIYSTVISSQGSINQCDGLAALAEIALQQARNIT